MRLLRVPFLGAAIHRLSHAASPPGTRELVRLRGGPARGLRMGLDLRFDRDIRDGTYEPELAPSLERLIRPGDVVYDVGANVGYYTLVASRLVGEQGLVYAFEPDPLNVEALKENVRTNGLTNVVVVDKAVWSSTGTIGFEIDDLHVGRFEGHVSVDHDRSVEAVTLDDFSVEARSPTTIKIDVEGGEEQVLVGARGLLESRAPSVVLELHNVSDEAPLAILRECGYEVEDVAPGKSPRHLVATPTQVGVEARLS